MANGGNPLAALFEAVGAVVDSIATVVSGGAAGMNNQAPGSGVGRKAAAAGANSIPFGRGGPNQEQARGEAVRANPAGQGPGSRHLGIEGLSPEVPRHAVVNDPILRQGMGQLGPDLAERRDALNRQFADKSGTSPATQPNQTKGKAGASDTSADRFSFVSVTGPEGQTFNVAAEDEASLVGRVARRVGVPVTSQAFRDLNVRGSARRLTPAEIEARSDIEIGPEGAIFKPSHQGGQDVTRDPVDTVGELEEGDVSLYGSTL